MIRLRHLVDAALGAVGSPLPDGCRLVAFELESHLTGEAASPWDLRVAPRSEGEMPVVPVRIRLLQGALDVAIDADPPIRIPTNPIARS